MTRVDYRLMIAESERKRLEACGWHWVQELQNAERNLRWVKEQLNAVDRRIESLKAEVEMDLTEELVRHHG